MHCGVWSDKKIHILISSHLKKKKGLSNVLFRQLHLVGFKGLSSLQWDTTTWISRSQSRFEDLGLSLQSFMYKTYGTSSCLEHAIKSIEWKSYLLPSEKFILLSKWTETSTHCSSCQKQVDSKSSGTFKFTEESSLMVIKHRVPLVHMHASLGCMQSEAKSFEKLMWLPSFYNLSTCTSKWPNRWLEGHRTAQYF